MPSESVVDQCSPKLTPLFGENPCKELLERITSAASGGSGRFAGSSRRFAEASGAYDASAKRRSVTTLGPATVAAIRMVPAQRSEGEMMGQSKSKISSDPAATDTGNYRWWLVGLLWFVCLFNYADRQAIFSVFPLLKAEMHLERRAVGSTWRRLHVGVCVGAAVGGYGGRSVKRRIILGGLFFWWLITLVRPYGARYSGH